MEPVKKKGKVDDDKKGKQAKEVFYVMDFTHQDPSEMNVTDLVDEVKGLRECVASLQEKVLVPHSCCAAKDKKIKKMNSVLFRLNCDNQSLKIDYQQAKFNERWAKQCEERTKEKLEKRMCDTCRRDKIDNKVIRNTIHELQEELKLLRRDHKKVKEELDEIKKKYETNSDDDKTTKK